jgi:hypothetical protein
MARGMYKIGEGSAVAIKAPVTPWEIESIGLV